MARGCSDRVAGTIQNEPRPITCDSLFKADLFVFHQRRKKEPEIEHSSFVVV
jgi:hypothetical protein